MSSSTWNNMDWSFVPDYEIVPNVVIDPDGSFWLFRPDAVRAWREVSDNHLSLFELPVVQGSF